MSAYIVSIILALLSVPFLLGKGQNFLKGYRYMTISEKENFYKEYNVPKMCRSIGILFIAIAVLIALIGYYENQIVTTYCIATMIAILLFFSTYINTGCKR